MSKSSLKGGRFADMAFIVVFRVIHSRGVQSDHLIRNTDMNVCVCSFAPVSRACPGYVSGGSFVSEPP